VKFGINSYLKQLTNLVLHL